ncbi:MAG: bi-domain-containing oxidoreductase [Gemmatimonadota bacterium]
MPLYRRRLLDWGLARARALKWRRPLRRGTRIVCRSSGWVQLEPFELPAPGPGEILVRASLTAVSPGTERARYNRLPNVTARYPYTPGYSGVGTVVEAGAGSTFRAGQRVTGVLPHASVAAVRVERCFAVPPGVSDENAAFLNLVVITLQGVRKAGIRWGDRVAVLGRGLLGHLALQIAGAAGASEVVLLGRQELAAARAGLPVGSADRGPTDGYEIVLDVTGNPEVLRDALPLASAGGAVVLLGSSRGVSPPWPANIESVRVRGAHAQTMSGREPSPGRWTYRMEGELGLDLLASGDVLPTKGGCELVDPREAWRFYRRLGRGHPPVRAALFDWRLLADRERARKSTLLPPTSLWRRDPVGEALSERTRGLGGLGRRISRERGRMSRSAAHGDRVIGIAMIGCGEIAVRNARAVAESGAAAVRWAVDPAEELARDLARRFGAHAAGSSEQALRDAEVDAVFICAPHHLHATLGLQAIGARKHVIVEKPTARTAREAEQLADAARSAGVLLMTSYPMRFLPQVTAARKLVAQGSIGRIQGVTIAEHIYKEVSYWFGGASGRSRSNWRAHRETSGGGVILMNLCHHLDVVLHVTGLAPRRIHCEVERWDAPGDVEDMAALVVRMEGGAIVSVDASTCTPGGRESRFHIWGSEGQIALDTPPRFLSLHETPDGRANRWNHLPTGAEQDARRAMVRSFAEAVLCGSEAPIPMTDSLAVMRLIDVAYASAESRHPMELPAGEPSRSADVLSNG